MRVDVIGENLCALVTASSLAQSGHRVRLVVFDDVLFRTLSEGECPFPEAGLPELYREQFGDRLTVLQGNDYGECAVVVFVSLLAGNQERLDWVLEHLSDQAVQVLVNQSSFPVGTSETMQQRLHDAGCQCVVVTLPELLQEGAALATFMRPDHILLGCDDAEAQTLMRELLRPYNRRRDVIQVMRPREAEFAKLAIGGMLAARLSLMNDLAGLAEKLDVDIENIRQAVGSDPRIGEAYLYPGCGFGGRGFSRDVMTLTETLRQGDQSAGLLEAVLAINEKQKEVLFRKFWQHYRGDVKGRQVAIWGAAFKPGSSKVDNAPVLALLKAFWAQGITTHVHDPLALDNLLAWAGEQPLLVVHQDPMEATVGCHALLLVTEWKCYWGPDWQELKSSMAVPLLLDGRNIYDPAYVRQQGFTYSGVGR
jgi:UDPglucose 6-dehydrogenase